jgi:hypothetical protein
MSGHNEGRSGETFVASLGNKILLRTLPLSYPKLECNMMRKLSAIAVILMLATQLPAAAYTQEDIDACTPDAMRLCQQAFPNKSRVVLCLVQNKRKLGPACTMAFNRARSVIAARERSASVQQTKF